MTLNAPVDVISEWRRAHLLRYLRFYYTYILLFLGYDVSLDAEWLISENHSENSLDKLEPKLYTAILDKIGVPHFEKDCHCRRPSIGNVILTRMSSILIAQN